MAETINSEHAPDIRKYERYQAALRQIPPPGCGCHTSLLSAANLGAIAEILPQEIFEDILQNIPVGSRRIFDREIQDAIYKAMADHTGGTFTPKPKPRPIVDDGKAALARIIEQSKVSDEYDLWELSPIRLWGEL